MSSALQTSFGPNRGSHGPAVQPTKKGHHIPPQKRVALKLQKRLKELEQAENLAKEQKRRQDAQHYAELLRLWDWSDSGNPQVEIWLDRATDPTGVNLEPVTELRQRNNQKCAREARRANRGLDRKKRFKRWAKKAAMMFN